MNVKEGEILLFENKTIAKVTKTTEDDIKLRCIRPLVNKYGEFEVRSYSFPRNMTKKILLKNSYTKLNNEKLLKALFFYREQTNDF